MNKTITQEQIRDAADKSVIGMHSSFDNLEISLAHTGFEQGAEWAIKQLTPQWISVKEQIPGAGLILVNQNAETYVSFYDGVSETAFTYWMPLPEPPKEGGQS